MALHTGSSQPIRAHHSNPLMSLANPAVGDNVYLPEIALADDPVPPDVAYQLIKDELLLDGSARLNLATFVTTWMEPQALTLMSDCADKNMIDKDEYPQTAEIERRCVAILADLWHATDPNDATGCSTTGSSEACMLAGMRLRNDAPRQDTVVDPDYARHHLHLAYASTVHGVQGETADHGRPCAVRRHRRSSLLRRAHPRPVLQHRAHHRRQLRRRPGTMGPSRRPEPGRPRPGPGPGRRRRRGRNYAPDPAAGVAHDEDR